MKNAMIVGLLALLPVACRDDCAPGLEPTEQTVVVTEGLPTLACGGQTGNCTATLGWSRVTTTKCSPVPPGTTPPPLPNPQVANFDPFATTRYAWDYASSLGVLNASRLDVSGSTVPFANSGTGTILALNQSGTPIASNTISWSKSGTELSFAAPSTVATWMASQPYACGYDIKVNSGATIPNGRHTIAVSGKFNGQTLLSASREFNHTGQAFQAIALELE